jgi:signal transduction histidine kinase
LTPSTHRGQIFRKYALTFVILVGTVLLASGILELSFSYEENQAALSRIQREQVAAAATRIEQFLQETRRQIGAAGGGVLRGPDRNELLRLLRLAPAVTDVAYLDETGREQVRVSRVGITVLESNADFSADPRFVETRGEKTYFSPVYFRNESEPYMTMAVSPSPESQGSAGPPVVAGEVNLKFIWDVVSRIRIGEAGHAYVVDAQGRLIAHPDISLVLQNTDLSSLPQVRASRQERTPGEAESGSAAIAPGLRGGQVLTAHQPIEPPGWNVFVEQPLEEAFAPVYASLLRTAVLLLVGLGLSVLASLVLARRMVRPIQALRAGAAQIGAGALEQRIDVRSGDELETLAEEFNRMAERLRESYAELEQKVEARTEQLADALRELQTKSSQLEVASRHKSTFLANMSHELRTPLNAILGYTELIQDGIYGEVPEQIRGVLDRVQHSGQHLLGLINDVLDLSKIEAGQLALSIGDFSLADVMQTVYTAVEPLAAEKRLTLRAEVAPHLPAARGDERRITQVLLNLAGNAVKFTAVGEITLGASASDGAFVVWVSDTGPGIPEADQRRIFEEFQQVEGGGAPAKGGTGLGLAIARRIVELHGGRIWVESSPGRGSTFAISLPIRAEREVMVA